MIYFCADDYGLNREVSCHIEECINNGVLNKVSIFPNFDKIDFSRFSQNKELRFSLHLNLVEGKCMSDAKEIGLIADKDGNFIHTFGGLFKLNLFCGKKLYEQVYKEIKAQVCFWKSILQEDTPFCIDSHQHTHMIPVIFKALTTVLAEEKIEIEYMRIPAEPLLPYLKTPSLYFTYSAVNIIKQWLLNFLWLINKSRIRKQPIKTAYFMGILFSGKMDEKRVSKILPHYIKLASKQGKDIEILSHPGYLKEKEIDFKEKNVKFKKFYLSENRETEFKAAMNILKRGDL